MEKTLKDSYGAGAGEDSVQNLFSGNYYSHYIIFERKKNKSLSLTWGSINELNNE